MFKIFIKICLSLYLFATISYAEVIKKVDIQGNKRLSLESIVVFGEIELNQNLDEKLLKFRLSTISKLIHSKTKHKFKGKEI